MRRMRAWGPVLVMVLLPSVLVAPPAGAHDSLQDVSSLAVPRGLGSAVVGPFGDIWLAGGGPLERYRPLGDHGLLPSVYPDAFPSYGRGSLFALPDGLLFLGAPPPDYGSGAGAALEVHRFDPAADLTDGAGLLVDELSYSYGGVRVFDGAHVWMFGGWTWTGEPLLTIRRYTPAGGEHVEIATTLPSDAYYGSGFFDGTAIYLVGVGDGREIWRFTPATERLDVLDVRLPANPHGAGRYDVGVAWDGRTATIVGGRGTAYGDLDEILTFTPSEGTVAKMTETMARRHAGPAAVWSPERASVYVLGGCLSSGAWYLFSCSGSPEVTRYDPTPHPMVLTAMSDGPRVALAWQSALVDELDQHGIRVSRQTSVFRGTIGGAMERIATTTGTAYEDVPPPGTYRYLVALEDPQGREYTRSNTVLASVEDASDAVLGQDDARTGDDAGDDWRRPTLLECVGTCGLEGTILPVVDPIDAYGVDIPLGATEFAFALTAPPGQDMILVVRDASGSIAMIRDVDAVVEMTDSESFSVASPAPGRWTVEVALENLLPPDPFTLLNASTVPLAGPTAMGGPLRLGQFDYVGRFTCEPHCP